MIETQKQLINKENEVKVVENLHKNENASNCSNRQSCGNIPQDSAILVEKVHLDLSKVYK